MPSKILTVTVPNDPIQVIEIQVPGLPGAPGLPGPAGPPDLISIGTVATSAPGTQAVATISGATPNRKLNLTIPQGQQGLQGPPNVLTVGTINTLAEGQTATATITGTAPNQVLNLSIPRGYGVRPGGATGAVLQKLSATDHDTGWIDSTATSTPNTIVRRDTNNGFAVGWLGLVAQGQSPSDATRKDYVDGKTWPVATISDSTAIGRSLVTAADAAAARTAIGAGTSSLVIGTTATTAMAGNKTFAKADVGLGNADNTSDANKPVSTAQATAINVKADKASSEGLCVWTGSAWPARPTGYARVRYIGGTTGPTDRQNNDVWERDA